MDQVTCFQNDNVAQKWQRCKNGIDKKRQRCQKKDNVVKKVQRCQNATKDVSTVTYVATKQLEAIFLAAVDLYIVYTLCNTKKRIDGNFHHAFFYLTIRHLYNINFKNDNVEVVIFLTIVILKMTLAFFNHCHFCRCHFPLSKNLAVQLYVSIYLSPFYLFIHVWILYSMSKSTSPTKTQLS